MVPFSRERSSTERVQKGWPPAHPPIVEGTMANKNRLSKTVALAVIIGAPLLLCLGLGYDILSPRGWAIGILAWFAALLSWTIVGKLAGKGTVASTGVPGTEFNDDDRRRISRGIWVRKIWICILAMALPIGIANGIAHRAWLPTLSGVGINLILIYAAIQDIGRRRRRLDCTRLLLLLPWLFAVVAQAQPTASGSHSPDKPARSCVEAARKALGPEAAVLKCGHLTGSDALETVAAIRLKQFKETKDGVPVATLVVLRREKSQWITALTIDHYSIRNSIGYIAMDYIDDTPQETGYRVSFSGERSQRVPGFTITILYLNPDGQIEGASTDISWNPAVRRFQEYTENHDPEGFQQEKKNLPHIRTRKPAR